MTDSAAPVLVERRDRITVLTLNEPRRRNPLSLPMRESLHDAVSAALADDAIRAIVITGAEGTFCAGGDIASMDGLTAAGGRTRLHRVHRLVRLLVTGEKPVIAAVEGHAVGAGLGLAAACDVVVTAEDAQFASAFNKVGLMPDLGSLYTVPLRVGTGWARRLFMLGARIDGRKAEAIGLADVATPSGKALEEAIAVAERLATGAPLAHGMTKALLARLPCSLDEFLRAEADAQAILFTTEDFAEGRKAFAEKRPPVFQGR